MCNQGPNPHWLQGLWRSILFSQREPEKGRLSACSLGCHSDSRGVSLGKLRTSKSESRQRQNFDRITKTMATVQTQPAFVHRPHAPSPEINSPKPAISGIPSSHRKVGTKSTPNHHIHPHLGSRIVQNHPSSGMAHRPSQSQTAKQEFSSRQHPPPRHPRPKRPNTEKEATTIQSRRKPA